MRLAKASAGVRRWLAARRDEVEWVSDPTSLFRVRLHARAAVSIGACT